MGRISMLCKAGTKSCCRLGDRLSLFKGMNIFVAFFVLLLLLAESTPPAASSIPLIGAYYCLNMILITLSTLLSVVVVNLYFHGSRTQVPRLFKKLMLDVFARVFCMRAQLVGPMDIVNPKTALYVKNNREKRHQEIKYDRVGMFEMQGETPWQPHPAPTSNGNPTLGSDPDVSAETLGTLPSQCSGLEWEVKEIRRHLKAMTDRALDKEDMEKRAREWKVVALVLDRLFFFIYLVVLLVSAFTLFETTLVQEGSVDKPKTAT